MQIIVSFLSFLFGVVVFLLGVFWGVCVGGGGWGGLKYKANKLWY